MYTITECMSVYRGYGSVNEIITEDQRLRIKHSVDILNALLRKYFMPDVYSYVKMNGHTMNISPITIQKASEQVKKMKEAMENEINTFLETGEINLGFKDMELYERVQMLEGQSKDQTTVIVGLNDKVANLENELSEQKDQILAIRYLLELQMSQKNAEIQESQVAKERLMTKKEEEFENKINEMHNTFLCFFLPSIAVLIIAVIFSFYNESKESAFYPENRTLIMDRSS